MRKESPIDPLVPRTVKNVLAATLMHPERWWYLSALAKHLKRSPSSLQKPLAVLVKSGILKRREDGNRVYFQPDSHVRFSRNSKVSSPRPPASSMSSPSRSIRCEIVSTWPSSTVRSPGPKSWIQATSISWSSERPRVSSLLLSFAKPNGSLTGPSTSTFTSGRNLLERLLMTTIFFEPCSQIKSCLSWAVRMTWNEFVQQRRVVPEQTSKQEQLGHHDRKYLMVSGGLLNLTTRHLPAAIAMTCLRRHLAALWTSGRARTSRVWVGPRNGHS